MQELQELKQSVKAQIIESLNLQGMTPDEIDDNAPLFGEGLGLDSILAACPLAFSGGYQVLHYKLLSI